MGAAVHAQVIVCKQNSVWLLWLLVFSIFSQFACQCCVPHWKYGMSYVSPLLSSLLRIPLVEMLTSKPTMDLCLCCSYNCCRKKLLIFHAEGPTLKHDVLRHWKLDEKYTTKLLTLFTDMQHTVVDIKVDYLGFANSFSWCLA